MRLFPLLIACLILALSMNSRGQEEKTVEFPIRKGLEFEYTSAPAAFDLIEMLGDYDNNEWGIARRHMKTFKFYWGHALRNPPPLVINFFHPNTQENLAENNVFLYIRRNLEMKIAIETGAMKPENCLFHPDHIRAQINFNVELIMSVYEAGGAVHRLDIDNAIGHCRATINDSSFAVSRFTMLADDAIEKELNHFQLTHPDRIIEPYEWAEIEAYPAWPISDHIKYIQRLNAIREIEGYSKINLYTVDIDERIASDQALSRDFDRFISFAHSQNIRVGVIINGVEEDPKKPWSNPDLGYLQAANYRLARFKRLGLLDKADVIMVQSWSDDASGRKTLPRNVPEDGITGTNFFIHTVKCTADIVDCDTYPELE